MVWQVIDRSYSVAEMSALLGVPTRSPYKWIKAITPAKTGQQAVDQIHSSINKAWTVEVGVDMIKKTAVGNLTRSWPSNACKNSLLWWQSVNAMPSR